MLVWWLDDAITQQRIPAVTTAQIYKGSIAFIILQLIMVAVVVFNPGLVTGNLDAQVQVDDDALSEMLRNMPGQEEEPPAEEGAEVPEPDASAPAAEPEDDPAKAPQDSLKKP